MKTIELHGLSFGVERLADHDANYPWNENDILGAVSDWTRRDKRPGERVINTGRVGKRFYDFAAAVRKGRAEGMKGPQAAEAAALEWQWLKDYCDDKWHYIGARVSALLTVLRNPGMNQTDLRPTVLLSQQGTSRAVLALQGKGTAKEKYPALVASTPDPTYSRRNLLTPTPEAGALLSNLTGQVNKMLSRKREAH